MDTINKEQLVDTIPADELITGLCNKYYHHLKNKEAFTKSTFEERLSIAHEIVSEAKEHEIYFYRRLIGDSREFDGENKPTINLASNDYLGFTRHPEIIRAGTEAIQNFGAASGSVPMLSGTTALHIELEAALA